MRMKGIVEYGDILGPCIREYDGIQVPYILECDNIQVPCIQDTKVGGKKGMKVGGKKDKKDSHTTADDNLSMKYAKTQFNCN
jgi:hypothetical protein